MAVDRVPAASRYLLKLASDDGLVARVRAGNEQAFAVLFERHHRGILSFCRHMLGSREEAEDVVQQSFANAYKAMLANDNEINLKPWLYRIARNGCISVLRARHHDAELGDEEPSLAGLADQVAQRDQLRRLLRDVAALPADQREALVLAELHGNSHAEVAAIIGCEREKVKSLVFQARSSLISSRQAREQPCEEIRRQLSVLRGGALRRNEIRRHLQHCEGCRSFRREVKQQRQALAIVLPVVPSAALKLGASNAMAAAGAKAASAALGGGIAGGGSAAATGAGAGGGVAALVKGVAATVAVTVAAGGGAVAVREVEKATRDARPASIEQSDHGTGGARGPGGAAPGGGAAVVPGVLIQDARDRAAKRRQKRRLRGQPKRSGAQLRRGSDQRRPGGKRPAVSLTPGERRQIKAERRSAARERRRQRAIERTTRPKKRHARRRQGTPAPRRSRPPVGTTPAAPAPTDPTVPERGTTFPTR
jgi:RNA polymerase sigma factor (sigma-70 family)